MLVGIVEIRLLILESQSLKDKRRVIKSLMGRLASRHNISIAEIARMDQWREAVIGFAQVANEKNIIEKNISSIINFIEEDYRVEIIESRIEII